MLQNLGGPLEDRMDEHKNARMTPKGREAMVGLFLKVHRLVGA